ncbi:MAG: DUF1015 domain-containing protein [Lachnospiraceae bacterium]|nr:DUF1015 domain-containing protein [Lachnospiraceae bacterium]
MADIRPFSAIRPAKGMEDKIAALPYDVYSRAEAKEVVKYNQDSFLNIDRAETQFSDDVDTYADCVYDKAKELLWNMVNDGKFIRDEKPCYYIYQLEMDGRKQTGLVACSSVDDYVSQTIKRHENTRADKEVDRIRHVDTTNAQTGPIFLAFRHNDALQQIISKNLQKEAVYDFTADDGIAHRVWIIDEESDVAGVYEAFNTMDSIYIADGHHRCASAAKVALQRREQFPDDDKKEAYNYFLSVLFPDDELKILDYNRVLKDLNGMTEDELKERLGEKFMVETADTTPYSPVKKGEFGMYLGKTWYKVTAKEDILSDDAVEGLDVSLLQTYVLDGLFGIKDPKTDQRIEFVGGIRGLAELEKRVDEGAACAFSMYPTSIGELFAVADEGRLMPPKSTWFEPKLRSGLFIHDITRGEKQYDE